MTNIYIYIHTFVYIYIYTYVFLFVYASISLEKTFLINYPPVEHEYGEAGHVKIIFPIGMDPSQKGFVGLLEAMGAPYPVQRYLQYCKSGI